MWQNRNEIQVGSSSWDKNEQRVLEDGLRYYPHEQHSNMLIYIRIAASLPKKTVRDVAHHLRQMQVSSGSLPRVPVRGTACWRLSFLAAVPSLFLITRA